MERNNIVFLSKTESAQIKAALILVASAQHATPGADRAESEYRQQNARNLLSLADRFTILPPDAPAPV